MSFSFPAAVYVLCFLTSVTCAVLLARSHWRTGARLLLWSALCFAFLAINNLIGLGGGIYALGALSEELTPTYGNEALRYSMLCALALYLFAALLMGLAGPNLRKAWVADQSI